MNTEEVVEVSAKEKELTAKLEKFCNENNLPHECAMDLLNIAEHPDQWIFLLKFIDEWTEAKLAGEI